MCLFAVRKPRYGICAIKGLLHVSSYQTAMTVRRFQYESYCMSVLLLLYGCRTAAVWWPQTLRTVVSTHPPETWKTPLAAFVAQIINSVCHYHNRILYILETFLTVTPQQIASFQSLHFLHMYCFYLKMRGINI